MTHKLGVAQGAVKASGGRRVGSARGEREFNGDHKPQRKRMRRASEGAEPVDSSLRALPTTDPCSDEDALLKTGTHLCVRFPQSAEVQK